MATTENLYTGNGSTVLYSFTFPYLKTTDVKITLDGTATTAYSLANATQVQFNTAPASGVAIRIFRETSSDELAASFFSGASIRADDLNNNFLQNIYVTQEAEYDVGQAVTAANAATSTANTALSTANTASTTASNAVTTANTANTNATAAQAAATAAASDATAAASSASAAQSSATAAASSASAASSSATQAISDAAAAQATADANTTRSVASKIVTDAFTATGDPATALSVDVPIDAANGVKLPTSSNSYDEEGAIRYNTALDKIEIRKGSGWSTAAGGAAISSTPPTLATAGDVWYDHDNGRAYVYYNDGDSDQWVEMNPSWNGYVADNSVTSSKIVDGTIVNADVNASAAIAGTKISPDFGSQDVLTTGKLLLGTPTARSNFYYSTTGRTPGFQFESSGSDSGISVLRTDGLASIYIANAGSVNNETSIGGINFVGNDGTNLRSFAKIEAAGDGAVSTADVPGRLVFSTTADGASSATERLRIDSSGNVGIGESDPDNALHVTRTGADSIIRLENTGNGNHSGIFFVRESSAGTSKGGANIHLESNTSASSTALVFGCGSNTNATGSERMRLNSSGNLGIGLNNPTERLHVYHPTGNINAVIESGDAGAFLSFKDNTTTSISSVYLGANSDYMKFATNGDERMRISSSGDVGIGTTSPGGKLHVFGAGFGLIHEGGSDSNIGTYLSGTYARLGVDGGGQGAGPSGSPHHYFISYGDSHAQAGEFAMKNQGSGDLCFYTGSSKRMQIANAGGMSVGDHHTMLNSSAVFQVSKTSGSCISYFNSESLADGDVSSISARGEANGNNSRQCILQVRKHSGITDAVAVLFMDQEDGGNSYFWADNSGKFRTSSSSSHTGTTSGTVVGTQTSDERLKNIGGAVPYGLEEIKQLQPKQYALKTEPEANKLGFIAQEVESIIPEAVFDTDEELDGHKDGDRTKLGMEYVQLIPVLVNAIKELSAENADLATRITALETKVAQLEANN